MHLFRTRKCWTILGAMQLVPYWLFGMMFGQTLVDSGTAPRLLDYSLLLLIMEYPFVFLLAAACAYLESQERRRNIILAAIPVLYTVLVLAVPLTAARTYHP